MVNINGTHYPSSIDRPSVIVCFDGCEPSYLDEAIKKDLAPNISRFKQHGFFGLAKSVIPSYTNPNNIAIITGAEPIINGIPGNWIYDRKINVERAIDSPKDIKCETILERLYCEGVKVASITTKDKLRLLLGKGWEGINISAEMAYGIRGTKDSISEVINEAAKRGNNAINPKTDSWMYTQEPSHYALDLAIALMESKGAYKPDLLYVTLTDYIPHRYAPGTPEANEYFYGIDKRLGEFDRLGCNIGVTSDHGMKAKHKSDGSAKVLWLDVELDKAGVKDHLTILPITDKYSAHHGSLGGFAWIHTNNPQTAISVFSEIQGVEIVLDRNKAAHKYNLPQDLIGDVVVFGDVGTVFGTRPEDHKYVPTFLRSHGSLHEQAVPFFFNRRLSESYRDKIESRGARNFNIFDYVINGLEN